MSVHRMYLYLYYVPIYMLWSEEVEYARTEPGLWLWFAAECLDSVSHMYLKYSYLRYEIKSYYKFKYEQIFKKESYIYANLNCD